jgi:hypothetical protein
MNTGPPKVMIRPDDGEIFSINSDGTYSLELMKREFPNSSLMSYSKLTLDVYGFIPGYNPVETYMEKVNDN